MREREPCVYIICSGKCGTLYVGVTSNLLSRIHEHRAHVVDGFAARHRIVRLVWFEQHETMEAAITCEKRIKKWNRDWKLNLIERENPEWLDLAIGLGFEPLMR
ncbi:MAG: GIY-YIG nuclease family protein [Sphingomonadaceae bacterium]|nr:GIY-YIG nuclease family protein [Sphingomonadaceae bacterium]